VLVLVHVNVNVPEIPRKKGPFYVYVQVHEHVSVNSRERFYLVSWGIRADADQSARSLTEVLVIGDHFQGSFSSLGANRF
jgi:hypothetical protein